MIWELKALSCLLTYPSEDLFESLPEIEAAIQQSNALGTDSITQLMEFTAWLREADLTLLQSSYVATFDIGKHGSLNLFEHTQGDSRDRGQVMVELSRLYREHGLDLTTTELPDHLPVFLEFLAGLDIEDARVWLASTVDPVCKIDRELQQDMSPWNVVTAAILDFAGIERDSAAERQTGEMIPTLDAEYYEAPVTFGGSNNPIPS